MKQITKTRKTVCAMANELRKAGYSLSQAFKKAWNRVKLSMTIRAAGTTFENCQERLGFLKQFRLKDLSVTLENLFYFLFDLIFLLLVCSFALFQIILVSIRRNVELSKKPTQPQNRFILINEAIHHESASLAKNAAAFFRKGSPFPVLRFFCEDPGFLLGKRQGNL